MTARLANDASFAAELKARQTSASRPPPPLAPEAAASAPVAPGAEVDSASETDSRADDGAPEWPDEETEGAMLVEVQDREAVVPVASRRASRAEEAGEAEALPQLDDAVRQVPPAVRQTLDELFRAQFVQVRRVPTAVLKDQGAD